MLRADGQGGPGERDDPRPADQLRSGVGEPDPPPDGAAARPTLPAVDIRGDTEVLRALLRQAWERGPRPDEAQALAALEETLRTLLDAHDAC